MLTEEHKKLLEIEKKQCLENDRLIKELKADLNHIRNNNFSYCLAHDFRKIELFFINIYKKLKEKLCKLI